MILGSHNTMSYIKPQWWARPFNSIAKCQELSILEQISYGVKCFDFRIRFNKTLPIICHGAAIYDADLNNILATLNSLEGPIYVRIGFENIYGNDLFTKFKNYCKKVKNIYTHIKFLFCKKRPSWEILENNFDKPFIEIQLYDKWYNTPKEMSSKQDYSKYINLDVIILMDFVK